MDKRQVVEVESLVGDMIEITAMAKDKLKNDIKNSIGGNKKDMSFDTNTLIQIKTLTESISKLSQEARQWEALNKKKFDEMDEDEIIEYVTNWILSGSRERKRKFLAKLQTTD